MRGTLRGEPRVVRVAAAQMGPINREHARENVVARLCALLHRAADCGAHLVVFPELALTTFFPRWFVDDISEVDHYYERDMPSPVTSPLFSCARERRVGFCLGYAELTSEGHRYNTQVLVDRDGAIIAKYRKIHIPGHASNEPSRKFQHAERYYFEPSGEGFGVWNAFGGRIGMMICNDRRWPESYREMGLQGVELILCGYNTPVNYLPDPSQDRLAGFHNSLVMQSGAYQNGTFVVGVAKGGCEEGVDSLAESQIIAPSGEILAKTVGNGDEVIVADCDLEWCKNYQNTLFDLDYYRRPEAYVRSQHQRGPRTRADGSPLL